MTGLVESSRRVDVDVSISVMYDSLGSLRHTSQQRPYAKLCEDTVAELLATHSQLRDSLASLVETAEELGAETDPRPIFSWGPPAPAAENYRVTTLARDIRFALLDVLYSVTWGILFPLEGGCSIALEAAGIGVDIRDSPLRAQSVWENRRRRLSALALGSATAFATSFIGSTEALASDSQHVLGGDKDTCAITFSALRGSHRILRIADHLGAPTPRWIQRSRPRLLAVALKRDLEKLPEILDNLLATWRRYLRYTFSKQRAPISRDDFAAANDAWLRLFGLKDSWTGQGAALIRRVLKLRPAPLEDLTLRPVEISFEHPPSLTPDHAVT